jgi:hypothetical protein
MPDADVLTEQLHALADLGVDELSLPAVRARVEHDLRSLIERRPSSRPAWRTRGALVSAACVLVAVAVVAGALALIRGGTDGRDQTAANPGATALIARLAVLRRPQTATDQLPAHLHLSGSLGTIVPGLTRRIDIRSGGGLYLVVTTHPSPVRRSSTYPSLQWPARFGDQVSLISVHDTAAVQNPGFPAVDLDNATQLSILGRIAGAEQRRDPVHVAQIVPDGVARVRWHYSTRRDQFTPVRTTSVTDNVALAPAGRVAPRSATWLAADGTPVHTSSAAARRVLIAAQRRDARIVIGRLESADSAAAPALLRGFALFNAGRSSSLTLDGVTVRRPRLTDVPVPVLDAVLQKVTAAKLDPSQMREVTSRSGKRLWVIPGATGLCVIVPGLFMIVPRLAGNVGAPQGTSTVCNDNVASALADGIGETTGGTGESVHWAAGVLPRAHPTTTVPARGGQRRTIRPRLGVYFTRIP